MAMQQVDIQKSWRRWRYKNTFLLVLSLILFFYLARTPQVDHIIKQIGYLGYFGAFITGIFFVSTFTVAPAAIVLYHLAHTLQPIEIAVLAGLGAMVGDYVVFRFVKDRVFEEMMPLLRRLQSARTRALLRSPYFAWFMPVLGALVIASPFPDEIGVSMLGLTKIRAWQFFLVTFVPNTAGIFIVVSLAHL